MSSCPVMQIIIPAIKEFGIQLFEPVIFRTEFRGAQPAANALKPLVIQRVVLQFAVVEIKPYLDGAPVAYREYANLPRDEWILFFGSDSRACEGLIFPFPVNGQALFPITGAFFHHSIYRSKFADLAAPPEI